MKVIATWHLDGGLDSGWFAMARDRDGAIISDNINHSLYWNRHQGKPLVERLKGKIDDYLATHSA